MTDGPADPRARIDPQINAASREGLTGTAPADLYASSGEHDQISIAPDFAPWGAQPAWRHDFPIDWPQDQYVERRDFLKFMVLISAAFTAGHFWIGAQNWWRKHAGAPAGRRIASMDDLAVGASLVFNYPGEHDRCLLVRLGQDDFVAFSQKCTHLSCAVIPRPDERVFYCPCHEGRFDLRTGAPVAGPPRRPLPQVSLEIRGGGIYATGVTDRTV